MMLTRYASMHVFLQQSNATGRCTSFCVCACLSMSERHVCPRYASMHVFCNSQTRLEGALTSFFFWVCVCMVVCVKHVCPLLPCMHAYSVYMYMCLRAKSIVSPLRWTDMTERCIWIIYICIYIYIYMFVCVYMCVCAYLYMYIQGPGTYAHVFSHMKCACWIHAWIHACMDTCIHTCRWQMKHAQGPLGRHGRKVHWFNICVYICI